MADLKVASTCFTLMGRSIVLSVFTFSSDSPNAIKSFSILVRPEASIHATSDQCLLMQVSAMVAARRVFPLPACPMRALKCVWSDELGLKIVAYSVLLPHVGLRSIQSFSGCGRLPHVELLS